MSDIRLQATIMLQEILEKRTFAQDVKTHLDSTLETDTAFANMLLQTSLRHLVYIKKILKNFIKKKLPASSQMAYYALILGATEALYLNTPDYAVINSYVEIVKKRLDKYVAGFVNAVLRRVCAGKEEFKTQDQGMFFPNDFRGLLNKDYGKKQTLAIEKAALEEPLLDITLKEPCTIKGAQVLPLGSLRLKNSGSITQINGYKKGLWWVQDFSSALPVKLLKDIKGKKVLDLCAAPGGKTAQLLAEGAKVTAVDISAPRLKKLEENLSRLNLKADNIICEDTLRFLQDFYGEPFDIILLDAPCSATGTLRRHPELVHIKSAADVEKMANLQKQLLNLAGRALKKDGILVYCTCSLCKKEGEEQIASFLQDRKEFKTISAPLPPELADLQTPEGWIRILPSSLPQYKGADGFFIALLKKEN